MIGRLRQLSEPRLRQQAGIEKSQTPVERDILIQWVKKEWVTGIIGSPKDGLNLGILLLNTPSYLELCFLFWSLDEKPFQNGMCSLPNSTWNGLNLMEVWLS